MWTHWKWAKWQTNLLLLIHAFWSSIWRRRCIATSMQRRYMLMFILYTGNRAKNANSMGSWESINMFTEAHSTHQSIGWSNLWKTSNAQIQNRDAFAWNGSYNVEELHWIAWTHKHSFLLRTFLSIHQTGCVCKMNGKFVWATRILCQMRLWTAFNFLILNKDCNENIETIA